MQDIKRENKQAIENFKKKFHKKKTVEDFRDEGDWDPGGMASGGRIAMAGGGALFKFIEKLFIKASNDIRLGRGKWKGLDQKQRIVQHDNLTKKVTEFQKTGKLPEGTEQYFDVNPNEAFAAASKKVKKTGPLVSDDVLAKAYDEVFYQKPASGDYKYDADVLSDSIAEQLGKESLDDFSQVQQTEIYNRALRRVTDDLKMKRNLKDVEQKIELQMFDPKDRKPNAEGGITRAGFPFGGQALKAIRKAWRANKDWGVGGPPYNIDATSFDIKKLTKQNLGTELSLNDLRKLESSPLMGKEGQTFDQFNQEFKIIKANILKTKLEESKLQAQAMIDSAKQVSAESAIEKRVQAQFARDGKKQLEEATEGLKEMDIYMGMLQKKGRSVHQSGGLAYMLGEPTYMKAGGGHVGHGPWTTGQAQQPQPQPQAPMHHAQGQPNPMKMPQGIPSAAPRSMDPRVMQQQAMQKAMMGQQRPRMEEGGTPKIPEEFLEDFKRRKYEDLLDDYHRWKDNYERRKDLAPTQEAADGGRIGLMYGGDPGFAFEYGGSWADWHDQHRNQMPVEDYIQTKLPKERLPFRNSGAGGGRIGFGLGGFNKARRAFLKMMAAVGGAGVAAGTGLLKLGSKAAPKVIKEAEVITRGADGMPKYIYDLIEVVKAKGTRDIIEGFKRSDYSTVHRYKGVEVIEEAGGATRIKKGQEKPMYGSDEPSYHEIEMEISPRYREQSDPESGLSWYKDEKGRKVYETEIPDEYAEYTAKPDMDGKLKDVDEGIDDLDHLELKEIADEAITEFDKFSKIRKKKASGGLAHMLGE